ncbi:MAG: CHAT domain-containing protein [Actinoplanes sp.]
MRSELIEFFRYGAPEIGALRAGDRYVRARGNEQVQPVDISISHDEFLDQLDQLRYRTTDEDRRSALSELSRIVTAILGVCEQPDEATQIDLVTNAHELSGLPFEMAVNQAGEPIFAVSDPPLVLTRRVRQTSPGARVGWWSEPKVLLAVADPPNPDGTAASVPLRAHRKALRDALAAWSEPLPGHDDAVPEDHQGVLTVLTGASLAEIRRRGEAAIAAGRPFTHLHILAHGCVVGSGPRAKFGLALHADDNSRGRVEVTPEQLRDGLQPLIERLSVVTLAACDSGNQSTTIGRGGSLADLLHGAGVPVVVASQFPLTEDGSEIFARTFYDRLLAGDDVREAVHATRVALWEARDNHYHDWASLVAYVQLPEDYPSLFHQVRLKSQMGSLSIAQDWADYLVEHQVNEPERYDFVDRRLRKRIESLINFLDAKLGDVVHLENLGLLGSAEKRLAELAFHRTRFGAAEVWRVESTKALERARGWYEKGFTHNLSHHWTGVQSLSLEAVRTGRIARVGRWHAVEESAWSGLRRAQALDESDPKHLIDRMWALGSRWELDLLASMADLPSAVDRAEAHLAELVGLLPDAATEEQRFPIESSRRQLQRYVSWWTSGNGHFDGGPDLSADAARLLAMLPEPRPRITSATAGAAS